MLQRQALFGIYLLLGREVKVDFLLILFLVFYLASTEWRKSPEPADVFMLCNLLHQLQLRLFSGPLFKDPIRTQC